MTQPNGFTLVELLAAMAAGSLLLIALGWTTGSLGDEALRGAHARQASDLAVLAPTLDRLAAAIIPGDGPGSKLRVSSDALVARIVPPAALGAIGPVEMTLDVERDAAGNALVLKLAPLPNSGAVPAAALEPVRLAGGFRSVTFSRETSPDSKDDSAPILLSFVGHSGAERTMAMVPRVTTNGSCRFDAISMACR